MRIIQVLEMQRNPYVPIFSKTFFFVPPFFAFTKKLMLLIMSIKECIAIITATAGTTSETFPHFFLNFLLSSTSSTSQLCVVTLMSAQAVTAPNYSVHSVTLRPKFWALVPKSPKWDMIIWNEVHLTPSSLPQRPSFPSALLDSYNKKSFLFSFRNPSHF